MSQINAISMDDMERDWTPRWAESVPISFNPFLSLHWLKTWWNYFGTNQRAEILLELDHGGNVGGALFTRHLRESYSGLSLRMVRAWVNNHCCRASIYWRDHPARFAQSLAGHWYETRRDWDALRLQGLPLEFGAALSQELTQHGFNVLKEREWSHDWLPIDQPWSDYYASLSHEVRRVQGRRSRRLQELGKLEFHRFSGKETAMALERYFDVEDHSWKANQGEIIRQSSQLQAFYRSAFTAQSPDMQGVVFLLLLDEQPIAGIVALEYANRLISPKISFRDDFSKYSPGWQVCRGMVEDSFQRGIKSVNFYAGSEFSSRWGKSKMPFCDLLVFGTGLRGRLAAVGKNLAGRLRSAKKEV